MNAATAYLAGLGFIVFVDRSEIPLSKLDCRSTFWDLPAWLRSVIRATAFATLFFGVWFWHAFGDGRFEFLIMCFTGINLMSNFAWIFTLRLHLEDTTFPPQVPTLFLFACLESALTVEVLQIMDRNWIPSLCWLLHLGWLVHEMAFSLSYLREPRYTEVEN